EFDTRPAGALEEARPPTHEGTGPVRAKNLVPKGDLTLRFRSSGPAVANRVATVERRIERTPAVDPLFGAQPSSEVAVACLPGRAVGPHPAVEVIKRHAETNIVATTHPGPDEAFDPIELEELRARMPAAS